jgi:hypothetical protein
VHKNKANDKICDRIVYFAHVDLARCRTPAPPLRPHAPRHRSHWRAADRQDTVNLAFVPNLLGQANVTAGSVIARPLNSFPFSNGLRAIPVTELG